MDYYFILISGVFIYWSATHTGAFHYMYYPHSHHHHTASWRNSANVEFLTKLCYLLEEHDGNEGRWGEGRCEKELWQHCGHHLTEPLLEAVRLGNDKTNLTECLAAAYDLTPALVAAAAPPKVRLRPYIPREFFPSDLCHLLLP